MIWLTWRQFRGQAIVAGCVLALVAVVLLISGIGLASLYHASGLPGCQPHGDCVSLASSFINGLKGSDYELVFYVGIGLIYATPVLIGAFWGAPLVARELETGSYRLAWNQSVTRHHWVVTKVALIGLAAMVVTGLLSLMVSWWTEPVYRAAAASGNNALSVNSFEPLLFGAHGIVPIGYAAFAFALGVTAGVLIKRTIPAMGVALASFVFVQVAWPSWIRPHLIAPLQAKVPLTAASIAELAIVNNSQLVVRGSATKPNAWVLSNQSVNSAGKVFTGPPPPACLRGSLQACGNSIGALHLSQLLTYQPASRFWDFQWLETGIFLIVAVALAWFCIWWVSRRRIA
jgi:hypothetical protein